MLLVVWQGLRLVLAGSPTEGLTSQRMVLLGVLFGLLAFETVLRIVSDTATSLLQAESAQQINARIMQKMAEVPYHLFEDNDFQARYGLLLSQASYRPGQLVQAFIGSMGALTASLAVAATLFAFAPILDLFLLILFPLTIATATIGLYSLTGTLVWGRVVFGIPLTLVHPFWFVITIPVTIIALGALGLVIGSSFILYRNANALANMLEFPVWIVTGAIVPLSLLPGWVHYLSWVLAPTWGFRAIRAAALGGNAWPAFGWLSLLFFIYLGVGQWFVGIFETRARERATLSLV
jgi:ABC-2 type transport system permease protein